jgi:hypothetical protein
MGTMGKPLPLWRLTRLSAASVLAVVLLSSASGTASERDMQWTYVQGVATCTPEYGQPRQFGLRSGVIEFCPYDPNKPDFVAMGSDNMRQAAQASCPLGHVQMGPALAYPYSSMGTAQAAHDRCNGNAVCVNFEMSGFYSKYNNPANCHP